MGGSRISRRLVCQPSRRQTNVVLGPVPPAPPLAGLALQRLWLCFATSVVAGLSSIIRQVPTVIGASVALLLTLTALNRLTVISTWLPTQLAASEGGLVGHRADHIWHAAATTAVAAAAVLMWAVNRLGNGQSYLTRSALLPRRQKHDHPAGKGNT